MTREEALKVAKPILFNTKMVRAILDERKTVTRRVIKHDTQAILNSPYHKEHPEVEDKTIIEKLCIPPYEAGDILYVRETWSDHYVPNEDGKAELQYCYKADGIDLKAECLPGETNRWYPSIHMPKKAARIFLKVTNVRVERLQDIMKSENGPRNQVVREGCTYGCDFIAVWNSTIKKQDLDTYGWDANPWVWVIEFKIIDDIEEQLKKLEK